jgi:hypothetical protein
LTLASFFLWNIGSVEQSSQDGLARGLLYHVLKQNPELTSTVLPHMWQEAQTGETDLKLPSNSEMKTAFQHIGAQKTTGAFAFFVDGLDEFTGNHQDGISFVKHLASSANIKLLVSSRPIDKCVAAFSSGPKLRLQDLTKPDIEMFIKDTIRSNPCVANLDYWSDTTIQGLIKDIQSKASGVFLWVVLACRTLNEGFEAYDDAEELQRRVDELPPELEDLFHHILSGLPVRFLEQCAKLLRVCYIRGALKGSAIPAPVLAWAHENDMNMSKLDQFDPVSLADRDRKCAILEGRLRSRCRGLLEVHRDPSTNKPRTVDFMHRTVFEFLNNEDIWRMDCLHIDKNHFEDTTMLAYMSCYDLYLRGGKITRGEREMLTTKKGIVSEIQCRLQDVARQSPSNLSRVTNRAAFALMQERDGQRLFGPSQDTLTLDDASLVLAVEFSLIALIKDDDVRDFNDKQRLHIGSQSQRYNLLHHALERPLFNDLLTSEHIIPCSTAIVDLLLRCGCDPNQQIGTDDMLQAALSTTPWRVWMRSDRGMDMKENYRVSLEDLLIVAQITLAMIRAGADNFDEDQVMRIALNWMVKSSKGSGNEEIREALRQRSEEVIQAVTGRQEQL